MFNFSFYIVYQIYKMNLDIKSSYCEYKTKNFKHKFNPFNKNAQIKITIPNNNISFTIFKKGIEKIKITCEEKSIIEETSYIYFTCDNSSSIQIDFIGIGKEPVLYIYNIFVNPHKANKKISIITLVRNTNDLLKESVASLLAQTNPNWENIIINDGSKKKVVIEDLIEQKKLHMFKKRFKIINLDIWHGLIKCHKIGIMHASNQIVGILDSDDRLEPNAIEEVLNIYNSSIEDNIFVYTNFNVCDNDMKLLNRGWSTHTNDTTLLNKRRGNHFRTFPRKYYFLTSGYDDDLIFGGEDQDILFKIEKFCKPIYLDEYLYNYRYNQPGGSISSLKKAARYSLNLSILKNIYNRFGNIDFYIEIYSNINLEEESKLNNYLQLTQKYVTYYKYKDFKFLAELKSNNITIESINNKSIEKYLDYYIENQENNLFVIDTKWDYSNSKFEITDKKFEYDKFRSIHPNTYFDNIYVINLKKDIERKERIERIFQKYNIICEFFEGVYGKELPNLKDFHRPNTTLTSPGQYGYILTMIKIFEDAKQKGYKKILVCDDDIILKKNFLQEFDISIKSIPYDWKVLFFGLSGPWSFNNNIFLSSHDYSKSYTSNLLGCDGSFCVGYDSNIYEKIIEISKEFILPYDTNLICYLNNNLDIDKYAFYPHLVIADSLKESEIINYPEEKSVMTNFERNHLKFMINLDDYELDTMVYNGYKELEVVENSINNNLIKTNLQDLEKANLEDLEKINTDIIDKDTKSYKLILICAVGRSGSTTLLQILNTIPDTNICGENANTILNLIQAYKSLNNPRIENFNYEKAFVKNNLKPCWYNDFNKDLIINQITKIIINFLDKDNKFKNIGFKEIRYDETNIELLKEFSKLFPNVKIILNYREDIISQSKSSWFKDRDDSIEKITFLNNLFKEYHENNNESTYLFSFENLFDMNEIKKLFDYIDEPDNFNEEKIKKILDNNLG